jgi:hypothetical protein
MANYYDVLKVPVKATNAEIKSAYRRLARKLHPDKNHGSEETAKAFAAIAEAYEVLGNPRDRARYDKRLLDARHNGGVNGDSVFASSNTHARRWRQLVYEHRYNEIIDRMVAAERREAMELQKIIFPTVALFLSTLLVTMFKPQIFANAAIIGKIIVVSLFLVGVIHLYGRIREGLDRFTYDESELHESILDDSERKIKPYSRALAAGLLVLGVTASFATGLLIGSQIDFVSISMPDLFSDTLTPEFVLYPPIFVLGVNLIHSIAARVEPRSHLDNTSIT